MWLTLIPVIIQYGFPVAEALWQRIQAGKDPTQADWDLLKQLASKTAQQYLDEAKANVPPVIK